MIIQELFDKHIPFEFENEGGVYHVYHDFGTPDKKEEFVWTATSRGDDGWNITFKINNSYQATKNKNNALEVMGFVIDITQRFAKEQDPRVLYFTGDKNHAPIYKALVKRMTKVGDWVSKTTPGEALTVFEIINTSKPLPYEIHKSNREYAGLNIQILGLPTISFYPGKVDVRGGLSIPTLEEMAGIYKKSFIKMSNDIKDFYEGFGITGEAFYNDDSEEKIKALRMLFPTLTFEYGNPEEHVDRLVPDEHKMGLDYYHTVNGSEYSVNVVKSTGFTCLYISISADDGDYADDPDAVADIVREATVRLKCDIIALEDHSVKKITGFDSIEVEDGYFFKRTNTPKVKPGNLVENKNADGFTIPALSLFNYGGWYVGRGRNSRNVLFRADDAGHVTPEGLLKHLSWYSLIDLIDDIEEVVGGEPIALAGVPGQFEEVFKKVFNFLNWED